MLSFYFAFVPLLHPSPFSASSGRSYGSQQRKPDYLPAEALFGGLSFCLQLLQRLWFRSSENWPNFLAGVAMLSGELSKPLISKWYHLSYSAVWREKMPWSCSGCLYLLESEASLLFQSLHTAGTGVDFSREYQYYWTLSERIQFFRFLAKTVISSAHYNTVEYQVCDTICEISFI